MTDVVFDHGLSLIGDGEGRHVPTSRHLGKHSEGAAANSDLSLFADTMVR